MPTHHYNHIFIGTQFLGRVLSAAPEACSQQIASVYDLLIETGGGEVFQGCGWGGGLTHRKEPGLWSYAGVAWLMGAWPGSLPLRAQLFFSPSSHRLGYQLCLLGQGHGEGHHLTCQCCWDPQDSTEGESPDSSVSWKGAIFIPDCISVLHFLPTRLLLLRFLFFFLWLHFHLSKKIPESNFHPQLKNLKRSGEVTFLYMNWTISELPGTAMQSTHCATARGSTHMD